MYQLSIDGIPQFPLFYSQEDRDFAVLKLKEMGVIANVFGGDVPMGDLGIKTTPVQDQLQYYMSAIFCPPHLYPSEHLKVNKDK